jgi:hypothetical protein
MTLVDAVIVGVLVTWLVLSVIANVGHDRNLRALRAKDLVGLLPIWWVFAPRPIEHDRVVSYRDVLDDGRVSDWIDLPPIPRPRLAPLWNPSKRLDRAMVDLCAGVSRAAVRGPARHVLVQLDYLLLLHHVCAEPRRPGAIRRQYRVTRMRPTEPGGDGEAVVVFESAYHRFTAHDP